MCGKITKPFFESHQKYLFIWVVKEEETSQWDASEKLNPDRFEGDWDERTARCLVIHSATKISRKANPGDRIIFHGSFSELFSTELRRRRRLVVGSGWADWM